ncbi:MAG: DNA repair protein RecN [Flavobacteriales bacterium]|nr:DNA repair protein RecN [Flavobacteriales bacterium]
MLQQLSIKNYALINELEISLSEGLSIITGETGAGKSILIGALGLLAGQRADVNVLQDKKSKCIVEGLFEISNYKLNDFFDKLELDFDVNTTIRREINAAGKSRAFINDTPVKLDTLKKLSSHLLDIHSQHEMRSLSSSKIQLSVIDAFSTEQKTLEKYQTEYAVYTDLKTKHDDLVEQENKSKLDLDYFQFQFNELEDATLKENELADLERDVSTLSNSEEIKANLESAVAGLIDREDNLLNILNQINSAIRSISKYHPDVATQLTRLESSYIELKDIAGELESLSGNIEYDGSKLEGMQDRLDMINGLLHKHRKESVDELILLKNDLSDRLINISSLENEIIAIKEELEQSFTKIDKLAKSLTQKRISIIPEMEKKIHELLAQMAMPDAYLTIKHTELDHLTQNGRDQVQFLFSANKGSTPKELNKVASGGELSRLMLAIKSIVAELMFMPTIIFDEIDTGVSGDVADKVGRIMTNMSHAMQVISITHLPQIASKGRNHFFVSKKSDGTTTHTSIRKLNKTERVEEIAKMLSGAELSKAALQNAKALLNTSE